MLDRENVIEVPINCAFWTELPKVLFDFCFGVLGYAVIAELNHPKIPGSQVFEIYFPARLAVVCEVEINFVFHIKKFLLSYLIGRLFCIACEH